jgi:threonine aldolase
VQRASACADVIAQRLVEVEGFEILNEVVLNQVLVRFGDQSATSALIAEIQRDGRIWCGPTNWRGETAMRISVSSWKTELADADAAATVIVECAGRC